MSDKIKRIGLWGGFNSGKTTLLASLYAKRHELGWEMTPENPSDNETRRFIQEVNDLAQKGILPAATPGGTIREYAFSFEPTTQPQWYRLIGRPIRYQVEIVDVSGEDITRAGEQEIVFESLEQSEGILMLIDPNAEHDNLTNLFDVVSRLKTSTHRFAFCLTKMDLDQNYPFISDPQAYLEQVLGESTYQEIRRLFKKGLARTFAVSAVGRYQTPSGSDRPNLIYVVDDKGNLDRQGRLAKTGKLWSPIGIMEPLAWLFERVSGLTVS
jgi:hypothetical protein